MFRNEFYLWFDTVLLNTFHYDVLSVYIKKPTTTVFSLPIKSADLAYLSALLRMGINRKYSKCQWCHLFVHKYSGIWPRRPLHGLAQPKIWKFTRTPLTLSVSGLHVHNHSEIRWSYRELPNKPAASTRLSVHWFWHFQLVLLSTVIYRYV